MDSASTFFVNACVPIIVGPTVEPFQGEAGEQTALREYLRTAAAWSHRWRHSRASDGPAATEASPPSFTFCCSGWMSSRGSSPAERRLWLGRRVASEATAFQSHHRGCAPGPVKCSPERQVWRGSSPDNYGDDDESADYNAESISSLTAHHRISVSSFSRASRHRAGRLAGRMIFDINRSEIAPRPLAVSGATAQYLPLGEHFTGPWSAPTMMAWKA